MKRVLHTFVRNRIAVAVILALLVFLGFNVVFFLAAPHELTPEIQTSPGGMSMEIRGGPTVEAIMSSPIALIMVLIAAILIIGWLIFSAKAALKPEQDTHTPSNSNENYTEYYNRRRPFQWFKAAFGCFGIHVALTILLVLVFVAAGAPDFLLSIIFAYMFFGWIPLAIWAYPFLLRRMK